MKIKFNPSKDYNKIYSKPQLNLKETNPDYNPDDGDIGQYEDEGQRKIQNQHYIQPPKTRDEYYDEENSYEHQSNNENNNNHQRNSEYLKNKNNIFFNEFNNIKNSVEIDNNYNPNVEFTLQNTNQNNVNENNNNNEIIETSIENYNKNRKNVENLGEIKKFPKIMKIL